MSEFTIFPGTDVDESRVDADVAIGGDATDADDTDRTDEHSTAGHDSSERTTAGPRRGRSSSARRESARQRRNLARACAEKALAVDRLDEQDRHLLSILAGASGDDVVSVTVALVAPGQRQSSSTRRDLLAVHDADPLEAGVEAAQLAADKNQFKAVWALAHGLDLVSSPMPPSTVPAKAGLALAKAVQSMDPAARDRLDRVHALTN